MKDKRKNTAVYFVEYEVQNNFLGGPVVQVTVWRNPDSVLSQAFRRRFSITCCWRVFSMIMSDAEQTKDAERFWRGRWLRLLPVVTVLGLRIWPGAGSFGTSRCKTTTKIGSNARTAGGTRPPTRTGGM